MNALRRDSSLFAPDFRSQDLPRARRFPLRCLGGAYRKISASSLTSGAAVAHIEQKAYRIAQLRLAWRLYANVTAGFAEYIAIGDGRVSILEKRAMNSEAQAFNATFTSSLKVTVRSKDAS